MSAYRYAGTGTLSGLSAAVTYGPGATGYLSLALDSTVAPAILTITVQTPRTPDALRKNPLGIFVNAINWSKELGS